MPDESQKVSKPLYRAEGVTKSERYLNKLAKRSFLSLWTYPSLFNDKGNNQELCDLLVVFDNHVLIFSDKNIAFPDTGNIDTDWRRWFKKAIKKSADQVWGAERWIKQHPDRIFLDPACTQPFPLNLPSPDEIIVHRIVVAHGAAKRCKKYFRGGSGSLMLDTSIVGHEEHFTIGQIESKKGFVHVFDDTSLEFVIRTLDTITDFIQYLTKKEKFLQSSKAIVVAGEENLLAHLTQTGE